VYGYSVSEIAQQTDRTKASVAGLLRRGLSGLRQQLTDLEELE
jgi:DNA-directed RNA polymerase specialized sigma24 family protein